MFALVQTRHSLPPRMAVVIAAAIFWLCQNSPSSNVQGCTLLDEGAILAAENKLYAIAPFLLRKNALRAPTIPNAVHRLTSVSNGEREFFAKVKNDSN